MENKIIVIDNFYDNPDSVRELALAQEFDVKGNFPGRRTKSFLSQEAKDKITQILGNITWNNEDGSTGSFQYTTALERSWIHRDVREWAGVCYLTPNAPLESGTILYQDKEIDRPKEVYDLTKFKKDITIGNVYNRLILYKGSLLHKSDTYFGLEKQEARLFQVFFLGELNA
jgi:predicted Zn-dependent protease with MMP-like domain